jgi:RNA polymerase sigma-70 factor (ECF subfamily)
MNRSQVEQLYRKYGPSVYRRAKNILRHEQDAKEAMQEVFVKVLSKGDTFEGSSTEMTWLYSITTNLCLNRIRNSRRRNELLADYSAKKRDIGQPHPELQHIVCNLLHKVSQDLAQVAVYYYFDEMTQEEISQIVGCSRRKVGDMLDRFKKALADKEVAV